MKHAFAAEFVNGVRGGKMTTDYADREVMTDEEIAETFDKIMKGFEPPYQDPVAVCNTARKHWREHIKWKKDRF